MATFDKDLSDNDLLFIDFVGEVNVPKGRS